MKRLILAAAAVLALAACASTPTVYQPAASATAVGYSDFRIEPGRYRITFRGGSGAPPQQVVDYALLRAADIAIDQGYDWFRVYDRFTESNGYDTGPHVGVGVGGSNYGHSSSMGVGVGTSFNLGPGPTVSATIEVVMGKGARPEGMDVYDPRAVRESIGGPRA